MMEYWKLCLWWFWFTTTPYWLKIAWMFIRGFFMEVKVERHSDLEGSSAFLSSIVMFM